MPVAPTTPANWVWVNTQDAIIDTQCAIAVASRERVIDMGTLPLADIVRDDEGEVHSFSIELVNCLLPRPGLDTWTQFQVTFDSDVEGDLFGVARRPGWRRPFVTNSRALKSGA